MKHILTAAVLVSLALPAWAEDYQHKRDKRETAPHSGVERQIRLPDGRSVSILKRSFVRDLRILALPDQPQQAIQVGTYWQCMPVQENFETCGLTIIVCSEEGEFCVEI